LVSRHTNVAFNAAEDPSVAGLARFFPDAVAVRLPLHVRIVDGAAETWESTVIEFGTPREVLFRSRLPLEFATVVELRTPDGALHTQASIIAMQYKEGAETAVAARFGESLPNWIVKAR